MPQKFKSEVNLEALNAATTDTDKFLVSDGGIIKFRTGTQLLSDIGGQAALTNPITGTGTSGQVSFFNGTTTQTGDNGLWWDNTNKRLGIGTTSPSARLDVNGNMIVGNGNKTIGGWPFYISDSSNLGWKVANSSGTAKFELYVGNGGLNQMRLLGGVSIVGFNQDLSLGTSGFLSTLNINNTTGNVGIGTTNPQGLLNIVRASSGATRSTTAQELVLEHPFNVGMSLLGGEAKIAFGNAAASEAGLIQYVHSSDHMAFRTANTEKLRINSSGNVGIGTTSPSQLLHVNGRALTNQLQYTRAINVSSTDLNNLTDAGFYDGTSLTNAPTTGWFYITVERYFSDALWVKQTATSLGSGNTGNITYTRTRQNGTWGSWVQLATTTGNVATATTLETTRTIWGQNFNGSANVTGNLTSVGNITGTAGVILTATNASLGLTATGNNSIAFTTNGSERWRINGIGELQASTSGTIRNTSGDLTITSPSGNIFITPPSARRTLVSRALVAMQGEGFGDMGMVGVLYDRNELTNAAYRGNVTITITGGGTYTDSLDVRNSIVNASGDFINISGLTTSSVVEIVVDTGANVNNYGNALWQPFFQTRLNRSLSSTNPNSILVEVSIDGTNWHTAASNGWAISDFLTNTDTVLGGLWMGLNANPSVPTSIITWRYARFTLSNFTIGTSNNNLWISEIGVRHQSAPVARQYLNQVGGNSIWGTQIINNGNVGIGATNPGARLEVNTTTDGLISIFRRVGSTKNNSLEIRGTEATGEVQLRATGTSGDQFLTFYTIGNERMRITNGGNVGIGTTSPTFRLDVLTPNINTFRTKNSIAASANTINIHNDSDLGLNATIYGSAYIAGSVLNLGANGVALSSNSTANFGILTSTNTSLIFGTNNTERIRITNGGNVGIGTTSPSERLDINGGFVTRGVRVNNLGSGGFIDYNNGEFRFVSQGPNATTAGTYSFTVRESDLGGSVNAMVIGNTGNVGIGTTTPTSRLQIQGSGTTSATSALNVTNSSGTSRLFVRDDGRVGVNTSTPNEAFEVQGNARVSGRIVIGDGSAGSPALNFVLDPDTGLFRPGNNILAFSTTGAERIRITATGEVGIGTTSPTNKLHVLGGILNGAVATFSGQNNNRGLVISTFNSGSSDAGVLLNAQFTEGVLSFATVGTERMRITSAGNVGIGLSSPSYRLSVLGSIEMNNGSIDGFIFRRNATSDFSIENSNGNLNFFNWGADSNAVIISKNTNRVCIGNNSTPSAKLEVNGEGFSSSTVALNVRNLFGDSALYVRDDLNVGIRTTNPQAPLDVVHSNNSFGSAIRLENVNTGASAITSIGFVQASSGGTRNASLNLFQNGDLDILINNGAAWFRPRGNTAMYVDYISSVARVTIGDSNLQSHPLRVSQQVSNISIYADFDIVAFSDQSVKTNIRPIKNVIERIKDSRGVVYDRIDSGNKDNIGFIAQELEINFPELVVTNPDGTKAVKYQNATAVLFEAIKEQQKQIDELKELVNKLIK